MNDDRADQPDPWIAILQAQLVPIYRWIYMRVGNREQAEELTTRALDTAIRERYERRDHPLRAPTNEAAREWLFQIARAIVADELRACYGASAGAALDRLNRGVEQEGRKRMTSDNDLGRANFAVARAHALLARLPARECEVLTCRFLLGYPIERTAAQLHLSVAETMALQFVALRHASQLDAVLPADEHERAQEPAPAPAPALESESESEQAQRVLEGCGCH